jgi:hypothetical protein
MKCALALFASHDAGSAAGARPVTPPSIDIPIPSPRAAPAAPEPGAMYDDEDLGLLERAAGAQAAAVAAATGAPDDAEMDEETALAMALAMSMGDTDAAPRYRPTSRCFWGFVNHVHVVAPRALPAAGPCVCVAVLPAPRWRPPPVAWCPLPRLVPLHLPRLVHLHPHLPPRAPPATARLCQPSRWPPLVSLLRMYVRRDC